MTDHGMSHMVQELHHLERQIHLLEQKAQCIRNEIRDKTERHNSLSASYTGATQNEPMVSVPKEHHGG